eukprot:c24688_g2_i1 orf=41-211(+)
MFAEDEDLVTPQTQPPPHQEELTQKDSQNPIKKNSHTSTLKTPSKPHTHSQTPSVP